MECHANEGYSPVDDDHGPRGCYGAANIPEGSTDGSDVDVAFDATNRGFVGKEDELTSPPVETTDTDEWDSHPESNPVENANCNVFIPMSTLNNSKPLPSSYSTPVASHTGFSPSGSSFHLSSDGAPVSSQLLAHHLISSLILSPSRLPAAPSSILKKTQKISKDAGFSTNWNSTSQRDDLIWICEEFGVVGKSAEATADTRAVHEDTEAAEAAPPFPEPETIGGRCRIDSTSVEEFRLVSKCGRRHVYSKLNLARRCLQYTRDIFTTMVDMEWKYHLIVWMASFCLTWVGFGILWWLFTITFNYDNDDYNHSGASNASQFENSTSDPVQLSLSTSLPSPPPSYCLENVHDITGAILFSIETQTTIGSGVFYIRSDCHPLAYVLFYVQILCGVCIAFFLSGVIFRKLSRPYGRANTILFSRYAVIRLNDAGSAYCLEFRMGDIRKSHIIRTSIRALLIKDRLTSEGERIPLCQYPLRLETQSSVTDCFVFMPWPIIVSHKIDADSPLWTVSRRNLREERFEIIVMFEGVVESTGASTQFRTSYLPSEVIWGHRFASLSVFDKVDCYASTSSLVDFGDFDHTVPVDMDDRCAKDFAKNRNRLETITEHRIIETLEHRVPKPIECLENGTSERLETGSPGHGYTETNKYTNIEDTEILRTDVYPSIQKVPLLPEAPRHPNRPPRRMKRRQSVKPEHTNGFIVGESLTAKGHEVNKYLTF